MHLPPYRTSSLKPALRSTATFARSRHDARGRLCPAQGDLKRASQALLAILIAELQINSRSEILPTYRVGAPVVCAQTSSMGLWRAKTKPSSAGGGFATGIGRHCRMIADAGDRIPRYFGGMGYVA